MASSLLNPSKTITEWLSKFLEFDPKQLQVAIWSGDVALHDVGLRASAIRPLLNTKNPSPDQPQLKLVKGTIGSLRMRIPWKRLVWGQGDVRIDIDDVHLVLAFESRQETKEWMANFSETEKGAEGIDADAEEKIPSELKQEWLRNAERLILQGLSIPSSFQSPKSEGASLETSPEAEQHTLTRWDAWIKQTTSDFAWRFFTGMLASVRNIRIVMIQDGIEIGIITHSVDVQPKNIKRQENTKDSKDSINPSTESKSTPPQHFVTSPMQYEGDCDEGEHVEKCIHLNGFGLFIRQKGTHTPKLNFIASVSADDYILRPADLRGDFTFFYPYPPETVKKKRKAREESISKSKIQSSSKSIESTTSSKVRRGKREKRSMNATRTTATNDSMGVLSGSTSNDRPNKKGRTYLRREEDNLDDAFPDFMARTEKPVRLGSLRRSLSWNTDTVKSTSRGSNDFDDEMKDFIAPLPSMNVSDNIGVTMGDRTMPKIPRRRSSLPRARTLGSPPQLLSARQHGRNYRSQGSTRLEEMIDDAGRTRQRLVSEFPSAHTANTAPSTQKLNTTPHIDLRISLGDIKTVFSTRHYGLAQLFIANFIRLRNGRPDKEIRTYLTNHGTGVTRSVFIDVDPASPIKAQLPNGEEMFMPSAGKKLQLKLQLPDGHAEKGVVVRMWWKYACENVIKEIRQRRKERDAFLHAGRSFDWELQKFRRKEYVDLYIANRLEKSAYLHSVEVKTLSSVKKAEELLRNIEDELPIEQLLLYRAIARALRVRGISKLPESIKELRVGEFKASVWDTTNRQGETRQSGRDEGLRDVATEDGTRGDVVDPEVTSSLNKLRKMCDAARKGIDPDIPLVHETSNLFRPTQSELPSQNEKTTVRFDLPVTTRVATTPCTLSSIGGGSPQHAVDTDEANDDEIFSQSRTLPSFKTAKSSNTPFSKTAVSNKSTVGPGGKIMKVYISMDIVSYELLLCEAEDYRSSTLLSRSIASDSSLQDGRTAIQLGANMKNLVTEEYSSDDSISDLSFASNGSDIEGHAELDASDEQKVDDSQPILSSTDFFFWGLPSHVLLRVNVSAVTATLCGSLVGDRETSISVGHVIVTGINNCHLLSAGAHEAALDESVFNQVKEVHVDKRRKSSKQEYLPSSIQFDAFNLQKQALQVTIAKWEYGKVMEMDMAKITVIVELEAATRLKEFITMSSVRQPTSVIPKSAFDDFSRFMRSHAKRIQDAKMMMHSDLSIACRVHGLEVNIPCCGHADEDAIIYSKRSVHVPSADQRAKMQISTHIIEYYDRSRILDVSPTRSARHDDKSVYSDAKSQCISSLFGCTSWEEHSTPARKLYLLNLGRLLQLHQAPSTHLAVVTFSAFQVSVHTPQESILGITRVASMLSDPLDVEIMITTPLTPEQVPGQARSQISLAGSNLKLVLSNARLDVIARFLNFWSDTQLKLVGSKINKVEHGEGICRPRLVELAHHVQYSLDVSFTFLEVAVISDAIKQPRTLSLSDKELILEECISDFLSILSCFDLDYPVDSALRVAEQVCLDRLSALGMTESQAISCVESARFNFLGDIQLMKKTQSDILQELAETAVPREGDLHGSTEQLNEAIQADIFSGLSGSAESGEAGSEESIELIESALRNAVERTLLSFLRLLDDDCGVERITPMLVIDVPNGIFVSHTKMFYDSHIDVRVPTVTIRSSAGIQLLRLGKSLSSGDPEIIEDSKAPGVSPKHNGLPRGATLSVFSVDGGCTFGGGGLPLSVLGSENSEYQRSFRETLVSVVGGNIDILFAQKVTCEVISTVTDVFSALNRHAPVNMVCSSAAETKLDQPVTTERSIIVTLSSVSLALASDELYPFCVFLLRDCSVAYGPSGKHGDDNRRERLIVESPIVELQSCGPECQYWPVVISTLEQALPIPTSDTICFRVTFYPSIDPWNQAPSLHLAMENIRFTLLRQFINELIQFTSSESHGVGLLLSKYKQAVLLDESGNPPPPLRYDITVKNSSVLLPRSSVCIDMVAIEVDKVVVANSYHELSFEVPSPSVPLRKNATVAIRKSTTSPFLDRTTPTAESAFFDCMDAPVEQLLLISPVSSFDSSWIRRITIKIEGARIFTSVHKTKFERTTSNGTLLRQVYRINGRASNHKRIYAHRSFETSVDDRSLNNNIDRSWEEISIFPLALEILIDYAPHLRVLISDQVNDKSAGSSINLDMRMAQFYLLLSIWYGNMQELPIMFPFCASQIKGSAKASTPPPNFPEYASREFVDWLKQLTNICSEIVCCFKEITVLCSFDKPGYYETDPSCLNILSNLKGDRMNGGNEIAFTIQLGDPTVHVTTDSDGVVRIGVGASALQLTDERKQGDFRTVFRVGTTLSLTKGESLDRNNDLPTEAASWANLAWGLDCDGTTLSSTLPLPAQVSVFMTPGWVLTNLGFESAFATMFDFTPIWIVLDYFSLYFSKRAFGNPVFEAEECKERLKASLAASGKYNIQRSHEGMNVDFRLWTSSPFLCIPSSTVNKFAPSLQIDCSTGLWYRYKSMGPFISQEIGSTNLCLAIANEFEFPWRCRPLHSVDSLLRGGAKNLIDGLSIGFRMDSSAHTGHADYSVRIPFLLRPLHDAPFVCKVSSVEIEADSVVLHPPSVCTPVQQLSRSLGTSICELTFIIDALPVAADLLLTLVTGSIDGNESKCTGNQIANDTTKASFSVSASIGGLRLFVIDPVLGMHLPIAVFCLSSAKISASQVSAGGRHWSSLRGEADPEDLQIAVDVTFWADYFKLGVSRSWEPLLEPFSCLFLLEKSGTRGQGMSINSDSELHINLTGALLLIMDEAITSFSRALGESFGSKPSELPRHESFLVGYTNDESSIVHYAGTSVEQRVESNRLGALDVRHHVPRPLKSDERVAFSILNLTGERIRIHQQSWGSRALVPERVTTVTYLEHCESTKLEFEATVSVIRNLQPIDVPFPGLPHPLRDSREQSTHDPCIDVQLPGFRWIQGMSVDTSGRRFEELEPRSVVVLQKTNGDWRLKNAIRLLTEVGIENGGRLITVRSLFEIRNNTSHTVCLAQHPDPTYIPISHQSNAFTSVHHDRIDLERAEPLSMEREVCKTIEPGGCFQVPTLLLESALRLKGSHLGSFWIRPGDKDNNEELFASLKARIENTLDDIAIGYCSRPVQLAKAVYESSQMFQATSSDDLAPERGRTGMQISCPISDGGDGVPLAPFCYTVEIRRSPLVKSYASDSEQHERPRVNFALPRMQATKNALSIESGNTGVGKKARRNDTRDSSRYKHGPVSYTLSIHPPLVIENLLPTRGRFELMHATRRSVLWFSDLMPGERIPVHTVGLDAPLLLLVNLGFCRTPVGEGALIHHGKDTQGNSGPQGGLRSFGKAVSKGTKQIGKTLTAISDSPVKRGKGMVFGLQNPGLHRRHKRNSPKTDISVASTGGSMGLDTGNPGEQDRRVHFVESGSFSTDDIATETVVVDSIGQRLTLGIENNLGGGGQRRISLFCPFWIVNTTEHALRYKQDKTQAYVSGTVLSPTMDGSKEVDGSLRNPSSPSTFFSSRRFGHKKKLSTRKLSSRSDTTVFAGKPGALATTSGRCGLSPTRIASLLEKEIPLETLSTLAFMFSFHEDVLALGHSKMAVQLADGTKYSEYNSDWSQGFSLDSVGVPQVIGMHCKDGRVLEVSVTISVAPGFLSSYSKIIRFTPRFVLVNLLSRPMRLWQDSSLLHPVYEDRSTQQSDWNGRSIKEKWHFRQDDDDIEKISQYELLFGRSAILDEVDGILAGTTAHHSALYITTASSRSLVPFHIPDTRGDRQFRIDIGGSWNLTPSFNADVTGEHTLKLHKAVDLKVIQHINTRASPHYKVLLPPTDVDLGWDGELGVWFETGWGGDHQIIVKGTKRGRYSFNHTDIHVGDELLRIDKVDVSSKTFAEAMKLLKERVAFVFLARKHAAEIDRSRRGRAVTFRQKRRLQHVKSTEDLTELGDDHLVLTFRTLEERLRRLRVNASKARRRVDRSQGLNPASRYASSSALSAGFHESAENLGSSKEKQALVGTLKIEMRNIHSSLFVVVKEQDPDTPPYRIENRAMNHVVFFRQRGCTGHSWNVLKPGETKAYTWEEPIKPRKLSVKIGSSSLNFQDSDGSNDGSDSREFQDESDSDVEDSGGRAARLRQILSAHYVDSEERAGFGTMRTVKLEEIGFHDFLPCPGVREGTRSSSVRSLKRFLNCQVDTNGTTRVLIISDNKASDERGVMQRHIATIERQIVEEEKRLENFQILKKMAETDDAQSEEGKYEESLELEQTSQQWDANEMKCSFPLRYSLKSIPSYEADLVNVEDEANRLATDFPEVCTISGRNQVIVEVLEATGLKPYSVSGFCNPYCEIVVKGRSKAKRTLRTSNKIRKRTYYIEKTLAPKWTDQTFIFDVPEDAISVTRGHSLQFRIRDFHMVGSHPYLGQTGVHLRSLRNQHELVGWYPLVGRTGRRELEDSQANWGRGSVKLRLQWIYSVPALLDYFQMISERRLADLRQSVDGMNKQLEHLIDSELNTNRQIDPFSVGRIPNLLGLKDQKQLLQQGMNRPSIGAIKSVEVSGIKRTTWSAAIHEPLRQSRDKLMWLLYFQTAESKINRRLGNNQANETIESEASQLTRDQLASIVENKLINSMDGSALEPVKDNVSHQRKSLLSHRTSLAKLKDASIDEHFRPSICEHRSGSTLSANVGQRMRSHSFENVEFDQASKREILDFAMRARSCTFDGPFPGLGDIRPKGGEIFVANTDAEAELVDAVNRLFLDGLIFHTSNLYFHKRHLSYKFRAALFENEGPAKSCFQPKAIHRVAKSITQFRSWSAAQAILNDRCLLTDVENSEFHVSLLQKPDPTIGRLDDMGTSATSGTPHSSCRSFVLEKLTIPDFAPLAMRARAQQRSANVYLSRNNFERACRRSLWAILNPGGWLTIRPITALHLTDAFTGMHVKLRYGAEVVTSQTVDARVTPSWTPAFSHTKDSTNLSSSQSNTSECDISHAFPFGDNDLQVYVEPQKTSGSLRLSVVGERLNHLKTELGVLYIPLGSAISCCLECMENVVENEQGTSMSFPMYVRWFPLMSPKDSVSVDGDMGNSFKPEEMEQLQDSLFANYFTPCIKLALIWQPNQPSPMRSDPYLPRGENPARNGVENCHRRPESPLTEFYFNADFSRLSMSVIDSQRALDLFSLTLIDVDIRYSVTKPRTRVGLVIGWIQLDQQDAKAREPVVLAPTPVEHPQPTFQFLAMKDNLRSKGDVDSYEYIGISLQELDLTVEESWMFELWDFVLSVVRRREGKRKTVGSSNVTEKATRDRAALLSTTRFQPGSGRPLATDMPAQSSLYSILFVNSSAGQLLNDKKVYVEQLLLGFVKVNLSYFKGARGNWELTEGGEFIAKNIDGFTQGLNEKMAITAGGLRVALGKKRESQSEVLAKWASYTHDEDLWTDSGAAKSTYNLPNIIAAVVPSISDAPLRLQGKAIEHIFESSSEIFDSIKIYYVNETLKQLYKIVGSLDFVGNPTMVLNSFATGVRDFFVTPSQEFLRTPNNPSRVGIGVAKGTLSLVSHSASGLFGFAAKMAATAGQAAASLSFDAEYQRWHRDMILAEAKSLDRQYKKRGLQSVQGMVTRPVWDIVRGTALGVSGLILSPYRGAQRKGGAGFVKGVALGVVGVITKPTVGVLDALTHFVGSIHDLAKSVNVLDKRFQPAKKLRLPSYFTLRHVLAPFDVRIARSVTLLRLYPLKAHRHSRDARRNEDSFTEVHVASEVLTMKPGVSTFIIVSTKRVMLCKVKKENTGTLVPMLCWEVSLCNDSIVTPKVQEHGHNGVALTITTQMTTQEPMIDPCTPAPFSSGDTPNVPEAERQNVARSDGSSHSLKSYEPEHSSTSPSHVETPKRPRLTSTKAEKIEFARSVETNLSLLGTEPSQEVLWAEADENLAEAKEGDLQHESHFHGTRQSQQGEIMEWYSVLAEFQHKRQLSRVHNAICCVTGKLDAIILDRGLGPDGSTEGYTSFGDLVFTRKNANEEMKDRRGDEDYIIKQLEKVPWVHEVTFKEYRFLESKATTVEFTNLRNRWTMQHEVKASETRGGPRWLINARADTMFVPERHPELPHSPIAKSAVIRALFGQLERGDICYNEAREMINALNQRFYSAMADPPIRSSESCASIAVDLSESSSLESFQSMEYSRCYSSTRQLSHADTFWSSPTHLSAEIEHEDVSLDNHGPQGSSSNYNTQEVGQLASVVDRAISTRPRQLTKEVGVAKDAQFRRPFSPSLDEGRILLSESADSPSRNPVPVDRVDRIERMIEQLVEITLLQAKQGQLFAAVQPPVTSGSSETAMLRQELEILREELKSTKDREKALESMQAELRSLRTTANPATQDTVQTEQTFHEISGSLRHLHCSNIDHAFRDDSAKRMVPGKAHERTTFVVSNKQGPHRSPREVGTTLHRSVFESKMLSHVDKGDTIDSLTSRPVTSVILPPEVAWSVPSKGGPIESLDNIDNLSDDEWADVDTVEGPGSVHVETVSLYNTDEGIKKTNDSSDD